MAIFIGLGHSCEVAAIMNRGGLRKEAMPFDWNIAYPRDIRHALDVDFSDWLDEQYISVSTKVKGAGDKNTTKLTKHSLYTQAAEKMNEDEQDEFEFFYHFDLSQESVKEAFNRKFDRFRDAIASDEHIVFVTDNNINEIKEAGLDTYFSGRKGKTTIVYLQEVQQEKDYAELVTDFEAPLIVFGYRGGNAAQLLFGDIASLGPEQVINDLVTPQDTDEVCKKICKLLESIADN